MKVPGGPFGAWIMQFSIDHAGEEMTLEDFEACWNASRAAALRDNPDLLAAISRVTSDAGIWKPDALNPLTLEGAVMLLEELGRYTKMAQHAVPGSIDFALSPEGHAGASFPVEPST